MSIARFAAMIACTLVAILATSAFAAAADSCVQCDSRDDSRCAASALDLPATECVANGTVFGCYSRIAEGHTERGCVASLPSIENCTNDEMCNTCFNVNSVLGCNSMQFPEIRLFCHQCDSTTNTSCVLEQTEEPKMCLTYHEDNECYIRQTNDSTTRGCISSSGKDCEVTAHCFICNGHGCNLLVHSDPRIPLAPSGAVVHLTTMALVLISAALLAVM